eukprot:gene10960-7605_t
MKNSKKLITNDITDKKNIPGNYKYVSRIGVLGKETVIGSLLRSYYYSYVHAYYLTYLERTREKLEDINEFVAPKALITILLEGLSVKCIKQRNVCLPVFNPDLQPSAQSEVIVNDKNIISMLEIIIHCVNLFLLKTLDRDKNTKSLGSKFHFLEIITGRSKYKDDQNSLFEHVWHRRSKLSFIKQSGQTGSILSNLGISINIYIYIYINQEKRKNL